MSFEFGRLPLSKKDRRELTPFLAREMVFDFVTGTLDDERRTAMEKELAARPELAREAERVRAGLEYAKNLGTLRISPDLLGRIEEPETYLSVLLQKTNFRAWPPGVRWVLEACMVLGVFLLILVAVPWDRALKFGLSPRGREIVLAEMQRIPLEPESDQPIIATPDKPSFDDEDIAGKTPSPPVAAVPPPAPAPAAPKPAIPTAPPVPAPSAVAAAPVPAPAAPAAEAKKPKAGEGALYRGTLVVSNLPVTGPRIADKILDLGGRKAGEVDLGWKKSANSAYYHFTMPEARYEELLVFLRDYGTPRIEKQKHPRVMPDGIIRLIVTVEEAKK